MVGGDALVLRIEGYELGAQSATGYLEHLPNRLHHLAARKVGERVLHRGDHLLYAQQATNGSFIPAPPFPHGPQNRRK